MAKRYGRNQKRKHLTLIKYQNDLIDSQQRDTSSFKRQVRDFQRTLIDRRAIHKEIISQVLDRLTPELIPHLEKLKQEYSRMGKEIFSHSIRDEFSVKEGRYEVLNIRINEINCSFPIYPSDYC